MSEKYRLMTPGPVQVPPQVLEELSKPMIHHRTPEFETILMSALTKLKKVFKTEQPVLLHPSTGSGGMESAIVNTLSPGDKVIVVCSGKFGERWRDIAKVYGVHPFALDVAWGSPLDPEELRNLLKANQDIKAVLMQACETSTAVLHPVKETAKLVREVTPNALIMVDAITALGVIELPMDEWGLDVVVGGSQKSFMLPTGLSMISLSEKAWKATETSKCPKYYWDLKEELKANKNRQTRFSTPVPLVRALNAGLDVMLKNGLEKNIERFGKLASGLRLGGEKLGLNIYAKSPSPSVTAFNVPATVNGEKLRDHLESKYNVTVMGGQDHLKGKIIRIGTLGFVNEEDIEATLSALANSLTDLGFKSDAKPAIEAFRKAMK